MESDDKWVFAQFHGFGNQDIDADGVTVDSAGRTML